MERTRRSTLELLLGLVAGLSPAGARAQNNLSRLQIEILAARTTGQRHTLLITTQASLETLRILVVYRRNGWRPGLVTPLDGGGKQLALATRLQGQQSSEPPNSSGLRAMRWELTFEEDGLPDELYAIVCKVSDIHGSRSLSRELPDVRRILDQVNEPAPSQREKSIDDVLRALYEFDWEPLRFTRLTVLAKRN